MAKSSFSLFCNQLQTGILSCPILYINHYHQRYVDDALNTVIPNFGDSHQVAENILEFDSGWGSVVNFVDKTKDKNYAKYTNIREILRVLVDSNYEEKDAFNPISNFEKKTIFLIKGLNQEMLSESDISLMLSFASKYESGGYNTNTTIIIVSPEPVCILPLSLRKYVTVLEILPPTVDEIRNYINECVGSRISEDPRAKRFSEEMVRTLQGLQMYEVKQTLKTVLALTNGRLTSRSIAIALEEKKRIVKKSGIIEVIDTDIRFNEVGGLDKLRKDLESKSAIYSNLGDAEKYNVPIPKGILIIGMPGCGKSMIAQATANLFGVSLLRLDVSRLMGKYVGESEANLRLALSTAEAAHPCVLWIDEIEKAFAGGNSRNGENDMLVMRMMGHFLTWMQERKTPVYIVATANDVMRPEFMRKGRFDEVYFVDFPNEAERADILKKKIEKKYSSESKSIFDFSEVGDCKEIVKNMKGEYGGFSGSEIECVLNMVVEDKFQSYLQQKQKANGMFFIPDTIHISKNDFKNAVEQIMASVMSNQKSKKIGEKTSIERIKEMQDTYHFVNASDK